MGRLKRFEDFRFLGARDTMRLYDCDDPEQFQSLERRVETDDLVAKNLIQSFGPDSVAEAANRGFRPVSPNRHTPPIV